MIWRSPSIARLSPLSSVCRSLSPFLGHATAFLFRIQKRLLLQNLASQARTFSSSLSLSLSRCSARSLAISDGRELLDLYSPQAADRPGKDRHGTPHQQREELTLEEFKLIKISMTNHIRRLAQLVKVRQRVIATVVVHFRCVYTKKKSLTEYDPWLIAPTCLYLESKADILMQVLFKHFPQRSLVSYMTWICAKVDSALLSQKKNVGNVNSRNASNVTPLHITIWKNHVPIIKRLLAAGCWS